MHAACWIYDEKKLQYLVVYNQVFCNLSLLANMLIRKLICRWNFFEIFPLLLLACQFCF